MQQPPAPAPKHLNPIQVQAKRELVRRTNEIKAAFSALDEENVRSVPEVIFVRDFLPLFSGKPVPNAQDRLATWYLIAGTPYMPVNIVNQHGQKVIQVPPVLDGAQLNPASRGSRGLGMGALVEDAAQQGFISPRAADGALVAALSDRVHRVEIPKTVSPEWQAVFDHYAEGKLEGKSAAEKAADPGESDFEM